MKSGAKLLPGRTICFRVVTDRDNDLEPGLLQIDLVESRSHIHRVVVDGRDDIVWVPPPAPAQPDSGANGKEPDRASAIQLKVEEGFTRCKEFLVRVDYSGGPPVVSGIRRGNGANGAIPQDGKGAATRIARRRAVEIFKKNSKLQAYYDWFTLLEERSDEDVLATQKQPVPVQPNGNTTFDVSKAISALRGELKALMTNRMLGAHGHDDKRVCTPMVAKQIASRVLLIHEHVFMNGVRASGVLGGTGKKPGDMSAQLTDAFLEFCQGNLRVVDGVSDLNVEPDSAMMFLFAEYALVLLQVVDQTTADNPKAKLPHPEAQAIANRLSGNAAALETWKRLAASFVLGQHAFMRAYAPSRSIGRPVFDDYVRTNFDVNQRLSDADLKTLRKHYDDLRFSQDVRPMSDPGVRELCARHASNACEAFPGDLDPYRKDEHSNHGPQFVAESTKVVTVFLRDRRGASHVVRRHVRREVASILNPPRAVATSETMAMLDIGPSRLKHLATMLAAYASIHRNALVEPSALKIDEKTTVDELAMRLSDLLDS